MEAARSHGPDLATKAAVWNTPSVAASTNGQANRGGERSSELLLAGQAREWATPSASLMNYSEDPRSFQARSKRLVEQGSRPLGVNLGQQASVWPTATVGDSRQSGRHSTTTDVMHSGTTMTDAIRNWPTPATRDCKGANGPEHLAKPRGHHDQLPNAVVLSGLQAPTETGAPSLPGSTRLNPLFVEWLMNWPENWSTPYGPTDSGCSEKVSFQSKQKKRSGSSSKPSRSKPDHIDQVSPRPARAFSDIDKDRYNEMASEGRKALLKKLAAAKSAGVGNKVRDGKYRWAVKKMAVESGHKGNRFQMELVVMKAAKIRVVSPANPPKKMEETYPDVEPDSVGSTIDWLQMLDKKDSPGPGNVRRMIEDLFGKKEDDDAYFETLAEVCDLDEDGEPLDEPLNLVKGMVIEGETLRIITKENKVEITVIKWSHVEQTEEEADSEAAKPKEEPKPVREPTQATARRRGRHTE